MSEALEQFQNDVDLAINVMGDNGISSISDDELIRILTSKGLSKITSHWIVIFVPTAMCRLMVPQVNWPNTFRAYDKNGYATLRFKDRKRYQIIEDRLLNFLETRPGGDMVLRISGRSPEFKVINEVMLKEKYKIEEIIFSELAVLYPLK